MAHAKADGVAVWGHGTYNHISYTGDYQVGELEGLATTRKIRVVRLEGKRNVSRFIDFYNLDMIISVGYRVNSWRGVLFRRWATGVLKEYLFLLAGFVRGGRGGDEGLARTCGGMFTS